MWDVDKGHYFKELRKKAGFSQIELAKAMDYRTKQPIFYVESGRQEPSPKFRINMMLKNRIKNTIKNFLRWLINSLIKDLKYWIF